jgi:processive 1,2-diacylglycerol beta-glucosyltransferase
MNYGYFRDLQPPTHHALFRLPQRDSAAPRDMPQVGKRKLLVLSVSAGAGHVRTAEAICGHANAAHDDVSARHIDVMDFSSPALRTAYTRLYIGLINRFPSLWSQIYHRTDRSHSNGVPDRLRRAVEQAGVKRLLDEIARTRPDAIVCTHFLPAEILARLRRNGQLDCPVWVQVTDFDLHRMWVHNGVTGYFAGNEEVAHRLRDKGISANTIHVTGIPVMSDFKQGLDRTRCARELGIDPVRPTLLLMGGGAGLGMPDQVAERLMQLKSDFQLIVMAGTNRAALDRLKVLQQRFHGRLFAHGFTSQVAQLMACSDLAITKPGGLTVSECLAMGLPMILNEPIPGQEERNADYLLEQGVALKASDAATLEYRVLDLLRHPDKLVAMRRRATEIGRAHAARDVVKTVLNFRP